MKGNKIYLQPVGTVIDTILDIVELQKAKITFSDTPNGIIQFRVTMYGFKWELHYTVTDIGNNRSKVNLEVSGDRRDKAKQIRREFALLDSMLLAGAQIEIEETEKQE